jgi:hypothetical protein
LRIEPECFKSWLAALGIVLAFQAAVLLPWLSAAGSPMDEGSVLTYADRAIQGDVPMRDLRSFYGPLNSYLVGGVFKLAGPSLYAERILGLVYHLVLAAALVTLVRRRGLLATAGAALLLVLLPPPLGPGAFAASGALASSCVAILLASNRRPFAAGAAAGIAVLLRFDWLVPVVLLSLPYLVAWPGRGRLRGLAGFTLMIATYVPYLALVGLANVKVAAKQLREGQEGRTLSLPHPPTYPGDVFYLMLFALLVLVVVGLRRRRTDEGLVFLSVALLGMGLLPYALVRADRAHIVIAATAPIVLLAAAWPAALEEFRTSISRASARLPARLRIGLVVTGLALVALLSLSLLAGARLRPGKSYAVSHDGRSFRLKYENSARTAELAVERADSIAPPDGRLFVGPADLRRTTYADSYMYFLLPRLQPATFYIALDPHVTERAPHRLVSELPRADVLILNRAYDAVTEANVSAQFGSPAPNRVVARSFCLRAKFGSFLVYARRPRC